MSVGKSLTPHITLRHPNRRHARTVVFELGKGTQLRSSKRGNSRGYDSRLRMNVFLTGTARKFIPAVSLDRILIGTGQPGPVTL